MKTNNNATATANQNNVTNVVTENLTATTTANKAKREANKQIRSEIRTTVNECKNAFNSFKSVIDFLCSDTSNASKEIREFFGLNKTSNKKAKKEAMKRIYSMAITRQKIVYKDEAGNVTGRRQIPCRIGRDGTAKTIENYFTFVMQIYRQYKFIKESSDNNRNELAEKIKGFRAQAMEAGKYTKKYRNALLNTCKLASPKIKIKFASDVKEIIR